MSDALEKELSESTYLDTFKTSFRSNFLAQVKPEHKFWFGIFMWSAFYIGYFTFCLNWIIFSNLGGSESQGWISAFKDYGLGDQATRDVRSDAVNYSITLARGFATIGSAWLMTKLTHKWAALIAFGLNCFALPLIFSPHYSVLVIGRMLMAIGGTMLIILIQPVISRFFDLKTKGILSAVTPTAYILAAFVANVIFVYKGAGDSVQTFFLTNWKTMTSACAALSFLPLLAYLFFGRNFWTSDSPEEGLKEKELPENTYTGIIKEKSTWLWSFFYSLLLVGSLIVSLKVPLAIKNMGSVNGNLVSGIFEYVHLSWEKIYICFFYVGCLVGMLWGKWVKTRYQRKPIVSLCCLMGLLCWIVIFGAAHIKSDKALATTLIYWAAFFFAFFAMGIQAVIMYIPHEYKENANAKRLTIFFAYLWGLAYIIYTIYQIIVTSCLSMKNENQTTGAYAAMWLITFFVAMFAVLSFAIKEPRPNYKFFPGLDRREDLWAKITRTYVPRRQDASSFREDQPDK